MRRAHLFCLILIAGCLGGCGSGKPPAGSGGTPGGGRPAGSEQPVAPDATPAATHAGAGFSKAHLDQGKPVGLYFMVRYINHSLEKAAWYFAPDGKVYQNLEQGLSAADLAAHKGPQGTFSADGKTMEVVWTNGSKTKSAMELDAKDSNLFMWDMGSFSPAEPFDAKTTPAGTYEGGESLSHGGNTAIVSKALTLRADGTFTWEGVSFLQGTTETSRLSAGASGATSGTWTQEGFTATLNGSDGKTLRMLAFPFDDESTPVKPDWMFFGGMMYKKK